MAENLKDKAYTLIKERILSCEYLPNQFLNENELIKEIDASRTPIREALNKLEQENLVKILPKKGVMVIGLSLRDIQQTFEARILLEPFIIKENLEKIDKDILVKVKKESMALLDASPSPEKFRKLDNLLHKGIAKSSSNRYFKEMLSHIYDQNHRIHQLSGKEMWERHLEAAKEHIELIDYILEGKKEEACTSMTLHLIKSKENAIRCLLEQEIS